MSRIASVQYDKQNKSLRVVVPKGTLPRHLTQLNEVLTNQVIPRLTGCPCLSVLDFTLIEAGDDFIQVSPTVRISRPGDPPGPYAARETS